MERRRRMGMGMAAALAAAACASTKPQASGGDVELLTYEPEVSGQSLAGLVLTFPWELQNQSSDKASVGAVAWSVELEDGGTVEGQANPGGEARAGSSASGALRLEVPLPMSAEALAQRQKATALRWHGKARFEVAQGGGTEAYEAEWHGEVFPSRLPQVNVHGSAGRYGDKGYELSFRIGLHNPNPFPVEIEALDYALEVHGAELSKDTVARAMTLAPSSEFQFDVQRFIGQGEQAELAKALQKLPSIPYRLTGTLRVAGLALPVQAEGSVSLPSR